MHSVPHQGSSNRQNDSIEMPAWIEALREMDRHHVPDLAIRPPGVERELRSADDLGLPSTMGSADPSVSVIVPTYRDDAYLQDALQCVGAQTYRDLEVVIVDSGGSAWVDQLVQDRAWIRSITTEPQGVSVARNDGIEAAHGDYVAFLDVDDYWHPDKLEAQLAIMGESHPVSFTGYVLVNYWLDEQPTVSFKDVEDLSGEQADAGVVRRTIDAHTSTLVCRTDILPDRPFDESLTNFEDVLFAFERFREHEPGHVMRPLAVRRLRPDSLADRTGEYEKSYQRIVVLDQIAAQHPDLAEDAARSKANEIYRVGLYDIDRNPAAARAHFRRAFSHRPLSSLGCYLLTLLPVDREELLKRGARFAHRLR